VSYFKLYPFYFNLYPFYFNLYPFLFPFIQLLLHFFIQFSDSFRVFAECQHGFFKILLLHIVLFEDVAVPKHGNAVFCSSWCILNGDFRDVDVYEQWH